MTPAEKIIVRFYSTNTFMFNNSDKDVQREKEEVYTQIKKALESELNLDYSVQQISNKWNHLCESFIDASNKVEKKQSLTYTENCILNRMYFLRSIIDNETRGPTLKYNIKNDLTLSRPASSDKLSNIEELLKKSESPACIKAAEILNSTILSYNDLKAQRLCLKFILKSIDKFKLSHV